MSETVNVVGIEFLKVGPPCTTAEIRQFEDWFGHTLPPPLRRLLATFGGAWPKTDFVRGRGDDELSLSTFLPLEGELSMRSWTETLRRAIPDFPLRFVPFADNVAADVYLIDVTDSTAPVFEFHPDTGRLVPEPSGLTLDDFLEGIRKADRLRKAEA